MERSDGTAKTGVPAKTIFGAALIPWQGIVVGLR
jgi:hypothetical protein